MDGSHNFWIHDLVIRNADIGVQVRGGSNMGTIQGVTIQADLGRALGGYNGHHGIW
jgi:hypothetical protein